MDLFAAWKGIREQLFDPRTNLFYDYTTSHDRAQKFRYLPAPEEVAADFPNPCGWGTGMEDCMLNAGSALLRPGGSGDRTLLRRAPSSRLRRPRHDPDRRTALLFQHLP